MAAPNPAQLAAALDEVITRLRLHPDRDQLVRDLLASIDRQRPGWLDQHAAATRQAQSIAHGIAGPGAVYGDAPGWVQPALLATLASWAASTGTTCLHAPRPDGTTLAVGCAWKPDTVVCPRCTHLLRLPRGSAQDQTCDACGAVVPRIYQCATWTGPLMWVAGLCGDCRLDGVGDTVDR